MSKKVIRKKLTTSGGMLCLALTKDLIGDLNIKNNSTVEISKVKGGRRLIIDFIEEEYEIGTRLISIPNINLKQLVEFTIKETETLKTVGKILQSNGIEYPLEVVGKIGGIIKKADRQIISKSINKGFEKNLFDDELTELIKMLLPKVDED